ncbi:hypothetical protein FNV43_RR02097 [Rhamnella rubrinervis]|uniref:Uncharacterized protein n=1 Tax=Rhamnella rubrinervis TaxID=2594499 RepID=A0A8K0HTD3_9ROSA|nr:hypothetical protein FNV43_RR02097 [Rhamnella rubrinervis]
MAPRRRGAVMLRNLLMHSRILLGQIYRGIGQIGRSLVISRIPTAKVQRHRQFGGVPLVIYGYPAKCAGNRQFGRGASYYIRIPSPNFEASANLARVSRRIIQGCGDIAHLIISNPEWHSKLSDKLREGIDQFEASILMWGFHVIPMVPTMTSLGAFLGVRYPRMLGYQFPNILHYNRLANDVFNKKQRGGVEKTYMINFAPEPEPEQEPVYTTRASTQSQPEGAHSQYLEGMINELREDFANMRADFGLQLAQQGSDIRELKTMVGGCSDIINNRPQCKRYNKHVVRDPHVDEDMDQFERNIDWAVR